MLCSMGSPGDMINAFSVGHLVKSTEGERSQPMLQLDFRTYYGASGSPVVNSTGGII